MTGNWLRPWRAKAHLRDSWRARRFAVASLVAFAAAVGSACGPTDLSHEPSGEPTEGCDGGVLAEGNELVVRLPDFEIKIRAGADCLRHFTWDGGTRSAYLWPRHEPWGRETGAYWPGPGHHWPSHGGVTRGVVRESVIEVDSVETALQWLRYGGTDERGWYGPFPSNAPIRPKGHSHVYRDDGLAVGVGFAPSRGQINVDVWQILIDGQKPTRMPGSINTAITLVPAASRAK